MSDTIDVKQFKQLLKKKENRLHNRAHRRTYNGANYHSTFEANVAEQLDWQLKAGLIKKVERQFKVSLDVNGKHITNYFVDFRIVHNDDSVEFIEAKGFETEVWRLKWLLFESLVDTIEHKAKLTIIKQPRQKKWRS